MTPVSGPSASNDRSASDGFVALSSYLIGRPVEADLAEAYLQRIRAEKFTPSIDELISRFVQMQPVSKDLEADVRTQIMASELGPLAEQVMLLWYTSAFEVSGNWKFGAPEQYFRADVWTAIGAHPPGLSGGYFGYWKYPPEN